GEVIGSVQDKLTETDRLVSQTQELTRQSEQQSELMIKEARNHMISFFEFQKELTKTISDNNRIANQNVERIEAVLNKIEDEKITQKLDQVKTEIKTITEAKETVNRVTNDVNNRFKEVESQVASLKSLQEVGNELVKARASESITLRAYQA